MCISRKQIENKPIASETPENEMKNIGSAENVDEPEDDSYLCGQTGCGLCALYSLKKAGITHLKLVGEEIILTTWNVTIRNLRKATGNIKRCPRYGKKLETFQPD